ncbi:uncharacterized protein K460DRAFT_294507 [Cucurbitaria berberidis CBS 394.84]|uniref:HMG box domain-containing protein n=1 Tax=Cucurbitaria berberidis CBS 394.84 TaxID=1168544 RepID=A0A9P4L3B5_9PLEO|nr:uncharacterized protein K460DRAFT_294507 [Cucurbitaria berberidis CBS 394.84]KAF1840741.1 hypothetical protein K460DRAFT_294507 [Cucurbitaria berberidis CBS 394.84]
MSFGHSGNPTTNAFDLSTALAQLGLSQYVERLQENGFEDWGTVAAITEADMTELNFRLGDRRKLQHAIREYSGSSQGLPAPGGHSEITPQSSQQAARTTRLYRRHPRPDPNAPHKPKTAYVLFGEYVRQDPALSHSSFTEIAKETGKPWRELPQEDRMGIWETPVADRLQEYKRELELYKQTENYQNHQTYLEQFKQKRQNPDTLIPPGNKPPSIHEFESFDQLLGPQEGLEATRQESVNIDDLDLEGQSEDEAPPTEDAMEEVRHISKALGVNPHLTRVTAFPSEDRTTKAVEAFVFGTGSLLYLWNQEEAFDLVRSVYHPQSDSKPVDATEVFAMAAVGSYCDAESHTNLAQEKFLHFFLYMLSSSSALCELRCMRLFACLAVCRFTNSVQSARRLMFSALSMGRQTITSPSFEAEHSEEKVHYWRNVFRSVVFLESWFAYNTSHDSRIYRSSPSHAKQGLLQECVGELGRLGTYIAIDLKTANQPKAVQASVYFESLSEWHRTLPPPMQLSRLSLADPFTMNWDTQRSLLQLHILFLGVFVEPFRTCLVDLGRSRLSNTSIDTNDLGALKHVEEQCVLAARQSARVASLLQTNGLIRSHCWVSIYTSFTGCAVLLFSASQRLAELSGEETSQELSYASSHLNILAFCSYDNVMARKLYVQLQIIFNDIREIVVSPVYHTMREMDIAVKDVSLVPLSHYDAVEGAEEVSRAILDITRNSIVILQQRIGN